jgi:AraC family transcriptional regulator
MLTSLSATGLQLLELRRGLPRAMCLTIHQCVVQRGVALAKTRLMAGDRISDVAASVGFANQSHLAYQMRRLLGVSPRQLRESGRVGQTAGR